MKKTALVYCEKQFGLDDGKTAVGLVRHSKIYDIVGIIDSSLAGKEAGAVLGLENINIPIFKSLDNALEKLSETPQFYIYGKAPIQAHLSIEERLQVIQAMNKGMSIVNGLHQLFSEDLEFAKIALEKKVKILDIRKSPKLEDLHIFSGNISQVKVPVIAVLGTDCACGKMTTAVELNKELNQLGIHSLLIGTGQTSLMQGSKYGASIDAIPSQFVIGEIEHSIVEAYNTENPDIILVEGQGAVGHEAFLSSIAILRGSKADGVIIQYPVARKTRCDFPDILTPSLTQELKLVGALSEAKLIAIALNNEGLNEKEVFAVIKDCEGRFGVPAVDILESGCEKIIKSLIEKFNSLSETIRKREPMKNSLLPAS